MKSRSANCLATVALPILLLPATLGAVTFNPRNFFVNNTKGLGKPTSCIASTKNNPGTYMRTFSYSAAHCPGVELFVWTKGVPQWAEEHFYDAGSYIKLLDDTNSVNGYLDFTQVLFQGLGVHGIDVFKDGNVSNSIYMGRPAWYVQRWDGNTCPSHKGETLGPFDGFEQNTWVGTQTNWLWDCRAGRPCQNGQKYPIEVFQRDGGDTSPLGNTDHSWWGRWQDPMDGNQWRGLGPVKFWCSPAGQGYCPANGASSESHYLVDCTVAPICFDCPVLQP